MPERDSHKEVCEKEIKAKEQRRIALSIDDAKPREVFGLPTLKVCQGREPPKFMSSEFLQHQSTKMRN